MAALTDDARELLEKPNFAHVATLMSDGSPQVSPVWVHAEGDEVVFNTAEGRVKERNMRRDDRVALSIADRDNPYASLLIRGRVAEITHDGADDHINDMTRKYLDQDEYPFRQSGEVRVKVRITPETVTTMG